MSANQSKPSHLLSKDIHTKLSDILDFGSDKIKLASSPSSPTSPSNTQDRLKKLVQQLQELNRRVDRLSQG